MISSTPTTPTEENDHDRRKEGDYSNRFLTNFPPKKFLSFFRTLDFSNNPILSLTSLPTIYTLEEIILDNTSIRTFEGCQPQPHLTSVSFIGSPICKCSFLPIMCVTAFGNTVKEVNGRILSQSEIMTGINTRATVIGHMIHGWLVYSYQPLSVFDSRTGERLNLNSLFPVEDAPALSPDKCCAALPEIIDLPYFKFPTRADVCDTPVSSTFAFTDSPRSMGSPRVISREIAGDSVNNAFSVQNSSVASNYSDSEPKRISASKKNDATKRKRINRHSRGGVAKSGDFNERISAEKESPLPKKKKNNFVSPKPVLNEPKFVVVNTPPLSHIADCLAKNNGTDSTDTGSSSGGPPVYILPPKENTPKKKKRRIKKKKKIEHKESSSEEDSYNEKGFASKRPLLQSDFESDSAYGTSISSLTSLISSDFSNNIEELEELESDIKKEEKKSPVKRKKHHKHHKHHSRTPTKEIIKEETSEKKKKHYDEDVPVIMCNFGTIHIDPADPEPKKTKKRKERKKSFADEPEIVATPFLDTPKRPKRKRLRKRVSKTIGSESNNNGEPMTEIFETDDYDEDEDPYFKKVNFYDLIGIKPDSNDEYFSQEEPSTKEEEEIIGPKEIIAELRKKGSEVFYRLRTAETSTLEEMEKYVSNYVRESLKKMNY